MRSKADNEKVGAIAIPATVGAIAGALILRSVVQTTSWPVYLALNLAGMALGALGMLGTFAGLIALAKGIHRATQKAAS